MRYLSPKRLAVAAAAGIVALSTVALPAHALLSAGGSVTVHTEGCKSVALARQAAYGAEFSSNTTGPVNLHTGVLAEATLRLCWSLDTAVGSNIVATVESNVTLDGLVSNTGSVLSDTEWACATINLKVAPGTTGTVSADITGKVVVDGLPAMELAQHDLGQGVAPDLRGEDIRLKSCVDSNGNVSAS